MKKLFLLMICSVMFGIASHAQTDTSKVRPQRDTSTNRTGIRPTQPAQPTQPVSPTQPTQPTQQQGATTPPPVNQPYAPTGWTPVTNQAVPDNLRQTLSTPAYQGWEQGTIYSNPTNGMYQLRTNSQSNPQVYYFDKDGKVTEKPPHE